MFSSRDEFQLFGCEVGELFFESGFFEIGFLEGPREDIGYFDLSLLVDEDIIGSNISYFTVYFREIFSTANENIDKIP